MGPNGSTGSTFTKEGKRRICIIDTVRLKDKLEIKSNIRTIKDNETNN